MKTKLLWLRPALLLVSCFAVYGCASTSGGGSTLAALETVQPSLEDVQIGDSLDRAAASYQRYLEKSSENPRTPEAMRRLADLQIEREYGVIGGNTDIVEMAAPESSASTQTVASSAPSSARPAAQRGETDDAFERRATARDDFVRSLNSEPLALPDAAQASVPSGPRQAIEIYWNILETYPNYERNDQVLYQLSRAYDEIGDPEKAMEVMDRFIVEYPHSVYVDEVYLRRGEYFFVRKKYLDAETSYQAIVSMGPRTRFYELALYKLGWAFYKQGLYEEALNNYVAVLDHRQSIGFDFEQLTEDSDEHRLKDTFRVISLSFSNLGGPEVVDEYFAQHGHRAYADKIYGNLGEFYFEKLRYEDATSVYRAFVALNPNHKVSPHFSMRVVEIYAEAGFPLRVL